MNKKKKAAVVFTTCLLATALCVSANAESPELPDGYRDSAPLEHKTEDYEDEKTAFDNFLSVHPGYSCVIDTEEGEIACHYITEFTVKEATCLEDGYRDWKCGICGEEGRDIFEISGHRFKDGKCIWCSCGMPEKMPLAQTEIEPPEDFLEESSATEEKEEFSAFALLTREEMLASLDTMDKAALERLKVFLLDAGVEDECLRRELILSIEQRLA